MIRPVLPLIALFVCVPALSRADLDDGVRARFGIKAAAPILKLEGVGPNAASVALRMSRYVRDGCMWAFVAEDGKAVATGVGRLDKLRVDDGSLLTENDVYSVLHQGEAVIAYNVSQERGVVNPRGGKKLPGAHRVWLTPLVLLDEYRTLCVRAQAQPSGYGRDSGIPWTDIPANLLYLAVIDDRVRGPNPNHARAIRLKGRFGGARLVGSKGEWYLLELQRQGRPLYLEVHGRTLATRPGSARAVRTDQAFWANLRKMIKRLHPQDDFVLRSLARWKGRAYFIGFVSKPIGSSDRPPPGCYVWDGERLSRTDPWTIVGASLNGRYGWLLNRDTGQSWLITH